jgi:hypothetical protein
MALRDFGLPDEGVDTGNANSVHGLDSTLDLVLVGTDIDDEDQSVVFFDLLHGRFGVKRGSQDAVLVHSGHGWDRLAWVLWSSWESQGLWKTEAGGGADDLLGNIVGTLQGSLLSGQGVLGSICYEIGRVQIDKERKGESVRSVIHPSIHQM